MKEVFLPFCSVKYDQTEERRLVELKWLYLPAYYIFMTVLAG